MTAQSAPLLVGIFVGGRGARMGGMDKGLLLSPGSGEALAARLARVAREALGDGNVDVVLVGERAAYAGLGLRFIRDDPAEVGPLGGLRALLLEGAESGREVIALACDLPYVTRALLARLATHERHAAAVAPRDASSGLWEPLFARYAPSATLPAVNAVLATKRRSLQGVFEILRERAVVLPIDGEERASLRDWDTPGDTGRES